MTHLIRAGILILLLVVAGAGVAGLVLGISTGSTGKDGTVAQQIAAPPMDASAVAPESVAPSAEAPKATSPPLETSAPTQIETATFALG